MGCVCVFYQRLPSEKSFAPLHIQFTTFSDSFFSLFEYSIFPNDWTGVIDHLRRNEIGVFFARSL